MSPIFKNFSDSASKLRQKISEEGITNPIFTYINPDAKQYCLLVSSDMKDFSDLNLPSPATLVILDDGSTNSVEFNEFTDLIRKKFPETRIIIAIPVVPESEVETLESTCDTLIYLHSEALFFSTSQFYQSST